MPGGDGTGPMGAGPMTGGGRGFCGVGNSVRRFFGFGRGPWGGGFGRGRRGGFYTGGSSWRARFGGQTIDRQEEMGLLKEHAELLSQELEDVRKRIAGLEAAKEQ